METSSTFAGTSFASNTLISTNVPSLSPTVPPAQPTTQTIPGTTVIGTGSTGDVWSYTIPAQTTVFGPSLTAAPTSGPAQSSAPIPESTLVVTNVVISGTTVTGGMETSVPWSYTIPDATTVSSFYVPIPATSTPSPPGAPPSSLLTAATPYGSTPASSPVATSSPTPLPPPPPQNAPATNRAALSGGIVAAILGALLLLMFAGAGCLWLRLRRRRRHVGTEWDRVKGDKGIGVVWGHGWGSEEKGIGAWRKVRPGLPEGTGTEAARSGFPGGPVSDSRQDLGANPGMNGSTDVLDGRPSGNQERDPTPLVPVQNTRQPDAWMPLNADATYPSRTRYPHAHFESDTNANTNVQTRTTTSQPHHGIHDSDTETKKPPSSSTTPPVKQKRAALSPPPFVYAPPPGDSPEPSPTATTSAQPYLYRPTSPPRSYRPTSPYGPNSPTQHVPKRLSKQRISPSTSAFLRHMVPTRGASLRRPKVPLTSPTPTSESGTATPSSVSGRPNISTLPSFIRERQFSPSRHSNAFASPSESALFSPSPRAAQLPPHSPRLTNLHMSRSAPSLLPPPPRSVFTTSRDGFLAPPPHGSSARDRYSQMTSTTRSGWTGHSRDSRMTGRSADTGMTGRSGDSRLTGRRVRLTQIAEGEREQGTPPKKNDRRRRHEGP